MYAKPNGRKELIALNMYFVPLKKTCI